MMESSKINLLLKGDVPSHPKKGKPKMVKTPGRPTSMKITMTKKPGSKV